MKLLLDDTKYWIENDTYPWKELAARFHHRLVQIHAFPNGNGRHARLMTEILLQQHDQPTTTWGIHKPEDTIDTVSANQVNATRGFSCRRARIPRKLNLLFW
jgi:fido (protein-threonine AMPylation protein)